jgi:hypothetical protein
MLMLMLVTEGKEGHPISMVNRTTFVVSPQVGDEDVPCQRC